METNLKMEENHFTKVHVCEHVSAYVFISKLNQSLTIKCKYCGEVTWSNKDDNAEELPEN
jgi:hypothetical protein